MLFDFHSAKIIKNITSSLKYIIKYIALRVGTDPLDRACGLDITVTADEEMIANAIKAAKAVSGVQVVLGKGAVLASGTTMDDD